MSRLVAWFRELAAEDGEIEAAKQYFDTVTTSHVTLQRDDIVVCRYGIVPFARDRYNDLSLLGAKPLNTFSQHNYAADLSAWAPDLGDLTPETWYRLEDIPPAENGPFFLKGHTTSRRDRWKTHAYAEDRRAAADVYWNLSQDSLVGAQRICIRRFVPLEKLMDGVSGCPVSNEHRFFILDGRVLTGAFYWSFAVEDLPAVPSTDDVPRDFLQKAIDRVKGRVRFFTMDVAKKADGDWTVVEINDGQQSGLSSNRPEDLYRELNWRLRGAA